MQSTLLLNSSYEPLHIIPWQRAITMMTLGKVEVIESYQKPVRSVSLVLKMPAVVRLLSYVGIKPRPVAFSRKAVYLRDGYRCQYCGKVVSQGEATIDHVKPRRLGGETKWTNVATACGPCNRKKGGRRLSETRMRLRKEPVAPVWLPVLTLTMETMKGPDIWAPYLGRN